MNDPEIKEHMLKERAGVIDCFVTSFDEEELESRWQTFCLLRRERSGLQPGQKFLPAFIRRCKAVYERQKLLIRQGRHRAMTQLVDEDTLLLRVTQWQVRVKEALQIAEKEGLGQDNP